MSHYCLKHKSNAAVNYSFRISRLLPLFLLLLFCLAAFPNQTFSQDSSELPAFYPIAECSYGIKEGLPDMYVGKVFLDKAGRLHISTRATGTTALSKYIYEYDGARAYPSGMKMKNDIHRFLIHGQDSPGRIHRQYSYSEENGIDKKSVVFLYDPMTRITQDVEIDGWIHATVAAEGALFVFSFPEIPLRQNFYKSGIKRSLQYATWNWASILISKENWLLPTVTFGWLFLLVPFTGSVEKMAP